MAQVWHILVFCRYLNRFCHWWVECSIMSVRFSWLTMLSSLALVTFYLVNPLIVKRGVLKSPTMVLGLFLLVLSVLASCILKFCCLVHTLDCYVFLVDWPFYHKCLSSSSIIFFVKSALQAHFKYIAGLVLGHHSRANIVIKQVKWSFGFPEHEKVMFTLDSSWSVQ